MSWWNKIKNLFKKKGKKKEGVRARPPILEQEPLREIVRPSNFRNPYRQEYIELWNTIKLGRSLTWYANIIEKNEEEYRRAGRESNAPWQVIAVIHILESGGNMKKQILNGQPWSQRTTIVPKGKGPWNSFVESCAGAFKNNIHVPDVWDVPNTLYFLETHNGLGYRKYRRINTPYLWSFTNHYTKGKYVADGKYDTEAVSKQCGCAPLLKIMGFGKGEDLLR